MNNGTQVTWTTLIHPYHLLIKRRQCREVNELVSCRNTILPLTLEMIFEHLLQLACLHFSVIISLWVVFSLSLNIFGLFSLTTRMNSLLFLSCAYFYHWFTWKLAIVDNYLKQLHDLNGYHPNIVKFKGKEGKKIYNKYAQWSRTNQNVCQPISAKRFSRFKNGKFLKIAREMDIAYHCCKLILSHRLHDKF